MKHFPRINNPFQRYSHLRRSLFFLLLFLSEQNLLDDAFTYLDTCFRSGMMDELYGMFPGAFR